MGLKNDSMISKVISLTIPNVITNITVPLLGMVDLAIVGHIGGGDYIGAIAIGTAIFNLVYWNFGFLRMGTTGMTAQAYGARDIRECVGVLTRAVLIAISIALLLVVFQYSIFGASKYFMNISDNIEPAVRDYFFVRIWAAPATISLYAFKGWFIGMQNSKTPMVIAIGLNIVNITTSLFLAYNLGMGIKGVALGTVIAQYCGVAIALFYLMRYYKKVFKYFSVKASLQFNKMAYFFKINKDIFLRTLCLTIIFTFFTSASSKDGDDILGANTLLMQLFTLFSYIMDGFAYAGESLIGKYYGANNKKMLSRCTNDLILWGCVFGSIFTLGYALFLEPILSIFTDDQSVIAQSKSYIGWIVAVPFSGFLAFLLDGVFIGMGKTRVMRDIIIVGVVGFFIAYYSLQEVMGNSALWLGFILFLLSRGFLQLFAYLRIIRKM